MQSRGWFKIPGIASDGDRTLKEQSKGIRDALVEAPSATVLDLGCAEGLIAREFALAGAKEVVGVELVAEHVARGRIVCADVPQMKIIHSGILEYAEQAGDPPRKFDIVLVLSVIHKFEDPAKPLLFAARSAGNLLLFRPPAWAVGFEVGFKRARHETINVKKILEREGFGLERVHPGARNEPVQYWRRLR